MAVDPIRSIKTIFQATRTAPQEADGEAVTNTVSLQTQAHLGSYAGPPVSLGANRSSL